MNRFEELQARMSEQGKSVFDYTIDWIEWSARKNLDIAEDVAEFTVAQLRLPVEAGGFADYRHGLRSAYSEFGEVLKHHGDEYVTRLRKVPTEVRDILVPKNAAAEPKPKPKPKKAKAKATKKAATAPGAKQAA